jgi:hypothetical protein
MNELLDIEQSPKTESAVERYRFDRPDKGISVKSALKADLCFRNHPLKEISNPAAGFKMISIHEHFPNISTHEEGHWANMGLFVP